MNRLKNSKYLEFYEGDDYLHYYGTYGGFLKEWDYQAILKLIRGTIEDEVVIPEVTWEAIEGDPANSVNLVSYVNTAISTAIAAIPPYTASNGITKTSLDFTWEGLLTKDTLINTDNFGVSITNMEPDPVTQVGNDSFAVNNSIASGEASFGSGQNTTASGDRSAVLGGANSIASGIGAIAAGTDGEAAGDYSFIANDANYAYGASSSAFGFGNIIYSNYGWVGGSDNLLGAISGAGTPGQYQTQFSFGEQNRNTHNYSVTLGRYLQATNTNAIAIGSGVSTTNRLVNSTLNSLSIGFNQTSGSLLVHPGTGVGTFGLVEVGGTLKIGSISQDDTETKMLVWNSTTKILEYRASTTFESYLGVPGANDYILKSQTDGTRAWVSISSFLGGGTAYRGAYWDVTGLNLTSSNRFIFDDSVGGIGMKVIAQSTSTYGAWFESYSGNYVKLGGEAGNNIVYVLGEVNGATTQSQVAIEAENSARLTLNSTGGSATQFGFKSSGTLYTFFHNEGIDWHLKFAGAGAYHTGGFNTIHVRNISRANRPMAFLGNAAYGSHVYATNNLYGRGNWGSGIQPIMAITPMHAEDGDTFTGNYFELRHDNSVEFHTIFDRNGSLGQGMSSVYSTYRVTILPPALPAMITHWIDTVDTDYSFKQFETTDGSLTEVISSLDGKGQWLYKKKVVAKTADYTVLRAESNISFTNEGATALINFSLPTAAANLLYTFTVQDADGIKITAAAGDTIRWGANVTAAAGNITSTTIGASITLLAINATEWMAISLVEAASWT
jgi:hypothetical protein